MVPTIGTTVELRVHEPPGTDPTDLLLDLVYTPPGIGLPKVDEAQVWFEMVTDTEYSTVSIIDCELGIRVDDLQ